MIGLEMEPVKDLVLQFYSQKGILPLDEEVLIQFHLQKYISDHTSIDNIVTYFTEAKETVKFSFQHSKKSTPRRNIDREPSRVPTDDERILYNLLNDYCREFNIGHRWVADWDHVKNFACDETLQKLVERYISGSMGTIPLRNAAIGGDRILCEFRIYTTLNNVEKWNKFFCAGLSDEDLFRIIISRHAGVEKENHRLLHERKPTRGSSCDGLRTSISPTRARLTRGWQKEKERLHEKDELHQAEVPKKPRKHNKKLICAPSTAPVHTARPRDPEKIPKSVSPLVTGTPSAASRNIPDDMSEIISALQVSLSRSRVCTEWLETGDCALGKSCPNYHS